MNEHVAPRTLILILNFTFFLSALHRIVWGSCETNPRERKGVIYSLVNLGSLLAIAWLGLMLGVSIPAFYFEGWKISLAFLLLTVYPVLFLIEIDLALKFLYWKGIWKEPEYLEDRWGWRMKTRLEGVFISMLAFVIFITIEHHQAFWNLIVRTLRDAL
ncbi:hypothetical protein ACQKP3_24410 [Vibrio sp. DNB22_10_4]